MCSITCQPVPSLQTRHVNSELFKMNSQCQFRQGVWNLADSAESGDLHAWWALTRHDGCKRGLADQDQCYAEAVEFAITSTKFRHIYIAFCRFILRYPHLLVRPADIPDQGFLCDLLWSDPSEAQLRTFSL